MNEIEARTLVKEINASVGDIRDKLIRLRDESGWKALGYDSWRDCATKEFKLGTSYVYRLVTHAEVEKSLPVKVNERVAREIAKLPEPERPKAYEKAVERSQGEQPTARVARAVVREMLPDDDEQEKPIKKVPRGDVKPNVVKALAKADDFRSLIRELQSIAREIAKLGEDEAGCHINQQACKADLNNVWRHLRFAAPHAPCPYCGQKGCRACRKLGWVPYSAWKNAPSDLTKGHE